MKVYVLETGCYENRYVRGVYDSPERAMADAHGKWTKTTWNIGVPKREYPNGERVSWDNDLDWDDAASILEYDLEEDGPLLTDYRVREQRYRASDGGWDYVVV